MDVLDLPDAAAWDAWLRLHHAERTEAWLRIARRRSGIATIQISDALDVALCHGWIDGQRRALDGLSFLQRYSRRRPRSSWSQVNVAFARLGRSARYAVILPLLTARSPEARGRVLVREISRLAASDDARSGRSSR